MNFTRRPLTSLLGVLVLGGAYFGIPTVLMERGNASARAAVERVYAASGGDYRNAPAYSEAIAALRARDRELGRPTAYKIRGAYTQAFGRPSEVHVEATRGKVVYEETLSLGDSLMVHAVSGPHDVRAWSGRTPPR